MSIESLIENPSSENPLPENPTSENPLPEIPLDSIKKRIFYIYKLSKRLLKKAKAFTILKLPTSQDDQKPLLKSLDINSLSIKTIYIWISSHPQLQNIQPLINNLTIPPIAQLSPTELLITNSSLGKRAQIQCVDSLLSIFQHPKTTKTSKDYKIQYPPKKPKIKNQNPQKPLQHSKKHSHDENDDDFSDASLESSTKPIKKNRPGQRARQAQWETQYGNSANHILKSKAISSMPNNSIKIDESLHPSWVAKKKLKISISNTEFQGKKVNFDSLESQPPAMGHPSWDAKRMKKEADARKIALAGKPSKIIF